MDRRTVVVQPGSASATAQAEQAIFTSIPSPMGRGYRIVAASAGITPDEKREIVQCAPSHGALCEPDADAVGLASFVLRSGRRCVFLSRGAGVEHTARGGCRLHTNVLLLDPAAFARFFHDPLTVERAARPLLGEDPDPKPPARLDALSLRATERSPSPPSPAGADVVRLLHALAAVLDQRRLLVVQAPEPRPLLRWLLDATPAVFRASLTLSYGLKLSPARSFQLVFVSSMPTDAGRAKLGGEHRMLDWSAPAPAAESPFETWLDFVRGRWQRGNHEDVRVLADHLADECTAGALAQIANLCDDRQRVEHANLAQLGELERKHAQGQPVSTLHDSLLREFRAAAAQRREVLTIQAITGTSGADPAGT